MKEYNITVSSGQSNIFCGEGAFASRTPLIPREKAFIVTDSNVSALYRALIDSTFGGAPAYVLPAGEGSKNRTQLFKILSAMFDAGATRSTTLVALGGGVVGDIAGLAASLYMRGVPVVQIPTTLLAQVDSSVGGKTAIDFRGIKNIVGAFCQPREVIVDPLFLKTLPAREVRCGLGEIIKYGALNGDILRKLSANMKNLTSQDFLSDITFDCIAHKAAVVCADERDLGGSRKTLNLGHTTGHAFELYYGRKSHGEYVLIGMYYELFIACKLGVCSPEYAAALVKLIKSVIRVPSYADASTAARGAKHDKKNSDTANISLILPQSPGVCRELTLGADEYCGYIRECSRAVAAKEWL